MEVRQMKEVKGYSAHRNRLCGLMLFVAGISLVALARADGPAGAIPAPPTGAVQTATVKGDRVNVRAHPAKSGETITQLRKGEVVTVLEIEKPWASGIRPQATHDWVRIALPETARVYVHKDRVADGVVKVAELNARSGPSLD